MKRFLSTILAVALLVGLGALAVLARPGANSGSAGAVLAASQAHVALEPAGPLATQKFNMIAMPLDATSQFTSAGWTFTANGLMQLAGGGTKAKQVGHWRADLRIYETWTWDPDEGQGVGTNFALAVGQAYWLLLEPGADSVISFVGDVPAQGSVSFSLVRGSPCLFNQFSIPLDRSEVTNANDLMSALNAQQVSRWVASGQIFESWTWDPDEGQAVGTNFQVKIGYPYVACLLTGTPAVWP